MTCQRTARLAVDAPRWLDEREDRAWRGYRRMRRLLDLELARELTQDAGLSEADYDVLSDLSETPAGAAAAAASWPTACSGRAAGSPTTSPGCSSAAWSPARSAPTTPAARSSSLTPAGRQAIESAAPGHVAAVRRHLIDLLTPAEIDALGALTHRVVDHLGGRAPHPRHDPEA